MLPSMKKSPLKRLLPVFLLLAIHTPANGGMREVLDAIRASEFRFTRTASDVPFMPVGWAQNRYYPNAGFKAERTPSQGVTVEEYTVSAGAVIPVMVRSRDMFLVGGDVSLDDIAVKAGPFPDQTVLRITPVLAWLHQFGADDMVGAFVAPLFSREMKRDLPWGTSGYGGIVAMHWFSESVQFLYGGVYENSFGRDRFYPYMGCMWNPGPRWSVALVFPWPTLTYAPSRNWILQLGISPGGSSWVRRDGVYQVTDSFGSWDVSAGVGYRVRGNFWLMGSVGAAGFRSWEIGNNDYNLRLESEPSTVFTIALQFRP